MSKRGLSYALITPARNEAPNLERLYKCLCDQTATPLRWIVVDDGSTDETRSLVLRFAASTNWVSLVDSPGATTHEGPLKTGRTSGRDMVAFNTGLAGIEESPDVVVKLDADVSFTGDYFEQVLDAFAADPSLGITSGLCLELENDKWCPRHVTRSHVRGATRAYRRQCLDDVSPLLERLGWDTVDEIQALLKGWSVRTLDSVAFRHHRRMGERDGRKQAWESQGALAWFLGYRSSYLILRALFRSVTEPHAMAMLFGWWSAALRREPRYPDPSVRAYLRDQQRLTHLPLRVREAMGRTSEDRARDRRDESAY